MMAKRECGSCRFFTKSGIGASGHCSNARCKDIVGIALVRKYELACRVGWDQDYYEPLAGIVPTIPGEDRPRLDVTRPRGYQGLRPDDMVVAVEQTRPVKSETSLTTQPSSRSRQSHVSEAHRRALERKQIAQRNGAPLPPRRLDGVLAPPPSQSQPATPGVTEAWGKTGPEGVSLPRRADQPPSDPATPLSAVAAVDVNAETAALPLTSFTPPPAATPPQRGRTERKDIALIPAPVTPIASPPGLPMLAPAPSHSDTSDSNGDGHESASAPANGTPARYPLPEGVEPDSLQAEWYLAERTRHRGKRCGNCRDFRAAETGERGYCRNRFAFLAPQLVTPNDLACLSCLGTWWTASDQWWLHHAQMSPQDAPTPQADRILDELRTREDRERPERHPYSG